MNALSLGISFIQPVALQLQPSNSLCQPARIVARLEQYEEKNGIPAYKKMAKIMKDTMKQDSCAGDPTLRNGTPMGFLVLRMGTAAS